MQEYEEEILRLIQPIFNDYGYEINKATADKILEFEKKAQLNNVHQHAITELKKFYNVTNGIPCLDVDIHKCDSPMIYEFWEDQKQLWIGQKDMDMVSWKDGKFHLGSAGVLNYGKEYEFENFKDLLKKAFKDWYTDSN